MKSDALLPQRSIEAPQHRNFTELFTEGLSQTATLAFLEGAMMELPQTTAYLGFNGMIDQNSVTRICSYFNEVINQGFERINFAFSSLGGYTADGIYLYNHIRALPLPITIHATGNIASIAVAIYLAGETRLCSEHVIFMMHPTSVPSSAEGMSWERLQSAMNGALAEEKRTDNILRDRTSVPDDIIGARSVREVHFSPEDAVKYSIAHEIKELSLPHGTRIVQI